MATIRQQIAEILSRRDHSARQIADALLITPAEAEHHLQHLAQSKKKTFNSNLRVALIVVILFEKDHASTLRAAAPNVSPSASKDRGFGLFDMVISQSYDWTKRYSYATIRVCTPR